MKYGASHLGFKWDAIVSLFCWNKSESCPNGKFQVTTRNVFPGVFALKLKKKNVIIITWIVNNCKHFLLESQRKTYRDHIKLKRNKKDHWISVWYIKAAGWGLWPHYLSMLLHFDIICNPDWSCHTILLNTVLNLSKCFFLKVKHSNRTKAAIVKNATLYFVGQVHSNL